ncbi:ABC transporter permease [Streptomyces hoynatensis]|uniref:FtsX-like permease family protein n=1 Tax=Streptomyces hoynatensis TaxID=1141874 RepID=A0A3A9Z3U6_9ACTN|nr:ABC transporter permease [Streptomyces hoynatensis]RKN42910.1 FtsX-like permease family protein [Streptomyces hoynatensis]
MTVLKTSLRSFFSHKGRMALSGLAIVLSVAFVSGTLVFSDTLNKTFDEFFTDLSPDVTVGAAGGDEAQDTGRARTMPGSLVDEVRAVEGVESAEGLVLDQNVTVVDREGEAVGPTSGAPTIAADWGPSMQDSMDLVSGHAPQGAGEVLIDQDTAERQDVSLGDALDIVAVPGTYHVKVSGITKLHSTNPGAMYVLLAPEVAATELLGEQDAITSVYVTAADGVSDEELKQRVAAAIGDDYEVDSRADNRQDMNEDVGGFLDVIRYAMLGFAGIAVLVGIFLIVNTFSMLVAQRTREIGLMRAIGSSRRQVNRSVLIEALLLGLIGSAVGVGAGIGLAVGLMQLMNSAGINMDTSQLTVSATTPVAGLTVGVLATVLAAWLPARRAARISPMAALREAGTQGMARAGRVRGALGLLLLGGGGAALVAAASAGEAAEGSSFLGIGLLLTLVGAIVVGPLLAGIVVRVVSAALLRAFGPIGRMAGRNARRNPRRTGATAGALMIGLALVGSLSVVGSSVVASAERELDDSVGADFIIDTSQQLITPEAAAAVHATPGLEHVTDYSIVKVELTAGGESSEQEVTAADPTYAQDMRARTVEGELADAYRPDHLSVGESFAEDHGLQVGDEVTARFAGGDTATLTLAAITSEDTLIDHGAMYMSRETARAHLPAESMPLNMVMFATAEDGHEAEAYAALQEALQPYPQFEVSDQADYKQQFKDEIGQLLNIVYALLALAIIVAVLGVVNTLTLSVVERTREIGLMRAIGLSRRQLRRMIRLESVVIALFGALLGLGLGMAWGTAAQRVLASEGFNVLEIPWPTIGAVFAGSAAVGLAAALLPAFRAGRMNVLGAIATD